MYTDYRMNDENVQDYQKQEQIIETISKRFTTYGYKRIKTSTFEKYDLYSQVNSSINQNEMIKVIDHTGEVLVLRPDVTIPITRQLAQDYSELPNELRYFYVQDVFRQSLDQVEEIESTQAGIEYFCESSPEADAEVIALACHTLKDLGFTDVKIEMGHAGFFRELVESIDISPNELNELKQLIQAKNAVDIRPFLDRLSIDKKFADAIEKIPFLYGNPSEVSERAKAITITEKLEEKLAHLVQVYEILKIYGLENSVIMDLGLINHMDYYSDVIFQGFVGKFGKPVLMGGRYNELGDAFGACLPAIGFACQVDSLVQAIGSEQISSCMKIDMKLIYKEDSMVEAIRLASTLRDLGYSVLSLAEAKRDKDKQESTYELMVEQDNYKNVDEDKTETFSSLDDLLQWIEGAI